MSPILLLGLVFGALALGARRSTASPPTPAPPTGAPPPTTPQPGVPRPPSYGQGCLLALALAEANWQEGPEDYPSWIAWGENRIGRLGGPNHPQAHLFQDMIDCLTTKQDHKACIAAMVQATLYDIRYLRTPTELEEFAAWLDSVDAPEHAACVRDKSKW